MERIDFGMISSTTKNPIDEISKQMILPLLYFDIFSYPLKVEEIITYTNHSALTIENTSAALQKLVENKILFRIDDFYLISNNPEKVTERNANNDYAMRCMPKARKMAKLISLFPFVQAVCISGSLSKNVMTAEGDIDFFIITTRERLWICRTLLILFKKIFLFNSHKYFCLNYFIDESHLQIEEQNRYTATEIVTLKPMVGSTLYRAFMKENKWATDFYPNFQPISLEGIHEIKPTLIQSLTSLVCFGKFGSTINVFLMKMTLSYWRRKFLSFDSSQFLQAFKSTPYVSKHHPNNFQDRVIKAFRSQIHNFEISNQINFNESVG